MSGGRDGALALVVVGSKQATWAVNAAKTALTALVVLAELGDVAGELGELAGSGAGAHLGPSLSCVRVPSSSLSGLWASGWCRGRQRGAVVVDVVPWLSTWCRDVVVDVVPWSSTWRSCRRGRCRGGDVAVMPPPGVCG